MLCPLINSRTNISFNSHLHSMYLLKNLSFLTTKSKTLHLNSTNFKEFSYRFAICTLGKKERQTKSVFHFRCKIKGALYVTLFAVFSKSFFSHQLNSKNNGPVLLYKTYLGIKTVFCRLLQRMARMDINSKLKTLAQPLQVLIYACQNHQTKV